MSVAPAGARHAEYCGLRSINANGNLRTAFLTADADVGDSRRVFHHHAGILRETARVVEVMAANFQLQPARSTVVVTAAAEEPHDLVVTAGGIGAHNDAGQSRELAPQ